MIYVWLGLAILLCIIEIFTTQLVSIWFVAGAVASAICAGTFLKDHIFWQFVVFVAVSAVALILTRPLVKKLKLFNKTSTNADRNIGCRGVVVTEINELKSTGMVEVRGTKWTARSVDGSVIEEGTTVVVEAIEGVKLMVTPALEE